MNLKALVAAVFDCNVYLQAAAREKSVAADCLRLVEQGLVRLYVSEDVLAEVEEVLYRPEIKTHFQALTDEMIEAFLLRLQKNAQMLRRVPTRFSYSRDPGGAEIVLYNCDSFKDLPREQCIPAAR